MIDFTALKTLDCRKEKAPPSSEPPEREHVYPGGTLKKVIWRKADGRKDGTWYHRDADGQWQIGRGEEAHRLYEKGIEFRDLNTVYIVEGEKDADTLGAAGCYAVSGENGAGSWRPEYTEALKGFANVLILPDNDKPGWNYARKAAEAVAPFVGCVRILNLRKAWPEIPKKGDISDMIAALGVEETANRLAEVERHTEAYQPKNAAPGSESCGKR